MKLMIFILRRLMRFMFVWLKNSVLQTPPPRTYRRTIGASVWHFSTLCRHWPIGRFEVISETPDFGVCPLCTKIDIEQMHLVDQDMYAPCPGDTERPPTGDFLIMSNIGLSAIDRHARHCEPNLAAYPSHTRRKGLRLE